MSKSVNQSKNPPSNDEQSQIIDLNSLKADPAERLAILKYHPNDCNMVQRAYIHKVNRKIIIFHKLKCQLEYSVSSDTTFCLPCYLFKDENIHQHGGDVFSTRGFWSLNKKDRFGIYVGGLNNNHYKAKKKCEDLIRQSLSIQVALDRQSTFRGHDEGVSSSNKGNFLELLRYHTEICQKDVAMEIIRACAIETAKAIIKDLNGDYFSILVDESRDVSCKEQMTLVLRYVDRRGFVMERFIEILHVRDTSALSLKETFASLLAQHSLSISYIRGQCYDEASNMQGQFNGLKALIQRENRSAHLVHYFSYQLQLTLVGISKKYDEVAIVVNLVLAMLNVVGASFKSRDKLRDAQFLKIQKALEVGELQIGRDLNQELRLAKPIHTRWGFINHKITSLGIVFGATALKNGRGRSRMGEATAMGTSTALFTRCCPVNSASHQIKGEKHVGFLDACLKFEFVFMLHFIKNILSVINELNAALQRKKQDIVNAIDIRWDSLIDDVSAFCIKHGIKIPIFDSFYVFQGESSWKLVEYTVLHHYRVEVFYKIIDCQLQELNNRFNEVTFDLLHVMAYLSPSQSFANFDIEKIMRLATLYTDDFTEYDSVKLRCQLENYIVDMGFEDIIFSSMNGIDDLSKKLVEKKKHLVYSHVYRLVKFFLLLSVAIASIEIAFLAIKFMKTDLRNRIEDDFLNNCLITYKERDIFMSISDDDSMMTFQKMKTHRG
ncbi:hypothetical protein CDL12_27780 [Handroanthus impetiginosus]|uniref:TTF-type domain-containing protein n=1 Tax=Handroanthus impetiginosus TaxID=429701 RepID=A0A2G9G351_9LAMI|nr:hypothetical protein CDL12_27780 [Handroanthus impetiginosus]